MSIDISGERLWVELKRVAEGRNAGPVLMKMFEQNIGEYLGANPLVVRRSLRHFSLVGIPSNADLSGLVEHWQRCHSANPHALTILMKLFRNFDEVRSFDARRDDGRSSEVRFSTANSNNE